MEPVLEDDFDSELFGESVRSEILSSDLSRFGIGTRDSFTGFPGAGFRPRPRPFPFLGVGASFSAATNVDSGDDESSGRIMTSSSTVLVMIRSTGSSRSSSPSRRFSLSWI